MTSTLRSRLSHFRLSRQDLIPDVDDGGMDLEICDEEATLLRAASSALGSRSQTYPRQCCSNNRRSKTPTPTTNQSIEELINKSYTISPPRHCSLATTQTSKRKRFSMMSTDTTTTLPNSGNSSNNSGSFMRRLSRLSFVKTELNNKEVKPPVTNSTTTTTTTTTSTDGGSSPIKSATASPASSMIFERSVQDIYYPESVDSSSGHYHNEDYIAPVLEASTNAITDSNLDLESVDVVSLRHHRRHPSSTNNNRSLSMSESTNLSPGSGGTSPLDSPKGRGRSTTGSSMQLPPPSSASVVGLGVGAGGANSAAAITSSHGADHRQVLSFYSFADVVSSENLAPGATTTAAGSPVGIVARSPVSQRSISPPGRLGFSPGSPPPTILDGDEEDVSIESMGETLRRNTEMSQ